MKKLSGKGKPILLTLLIVVTLFLLVLTSISLFNDLHEEEKVSKENKIYGTVLENGTNYVKVKTLDDEVYVIHTKDELREGDFIVAYFDQDDRGFSGKSKIEVIAGAQEDIINENPISSPTTTTSTTAMSTTKTTSKRTTTKKRETTSAPSAPLDDAEIISYFSREYEAISTYRDNQTFKEKAKEKFITFVDFIFYDGEIKGRKFDELTASAKAKVIYYTLLLDAKIDSKWPDYKDNIANKYKDIKAKLVAKYMEITTSICENNQDNCANVKNDFALLKKSIGLTWDVLKQAFSYVYNNSKEQLIKWYEVFSGKI